MSQESSQPSHKSQYCHDSGDSQFSLAPLHHQSFEHIDLHLQYCPSSYQLPLPSICFQALPNKLWQSLDRGRWEDHTRAWYTLDLPGTCDQQRDIISADQTLTQRQTRTTKQDFSYLICSGEPPDVAFEIAHAASFLISNSAFWSKLTRGAIISAAITACNKQ